jgi:hypothetical protein
VRLTDEVPDVTQADFNKAHVARAVAPRGRTGRDGKPLVPSRWSWPESRLRGLEQVLESGDLDWVERILDSERTCLIVKSDDAAADRPRRDGPRGPARGQGEGSGRRRQGKPHRPGPQHDVVCTTTPRLTWVRGSQLGKGWLGCPGRLGFPEPQMDAIAETIFSLRPTIPARPSDASHPG